MTKAHHKDYMRNYVRNQSGAVFNSGWTRAQVWALDYDRLIVIYERIKKSLERSGIQVSEPANWPRAALDEPAAKRVKYLEPTC